MLLPWGRQYCWTRFDFGRLISGWMRSPECFLKCFLKCFFLNLLTFSSGKECLMTATSGHFFMSAWMLEFWSINEFQGKILTNRRVSKNRHSAFYQGIISTIPWFYLISLRNITVLMLLTAFAAVLTWNNLR